jgi:hypothetical protein
MIRYERTRWPARYSIVLEGLTYLTRTLLLLTGRARVFLHRIWRPDAGRHPHNHPWPWACALILRGGYTEEITELRASRVYGVYSCTWTETHKAPCLSWRAFRPGHYHRITSVLPNTWTLFLAGPKTRKWGFLEDLAFVQYSGPDLDD